MLAISNTFWLWMFATGLLACLVTWLSLLYARRTNLVDMPGQRRSHNVPTPRGGGIGIVVAILAGLASAGILFPGTHWPLLLMIAVAMVALIGWIDDHQPVPAWGRLLVHFLAAGIWLTPLIAAIFFRQTVMDIGLAQAIGLLVVLVFVCVWSINLHNFMDGIDGLLAMQAIFVLSAVAVLCLRGPEQNHSFQIALWIAAIIGFLPFNFPRPRLFMGDVGSGAIGLLIAVAAIWQLSNPNTAAASGLVAASAFIIDASCTLVSRMLRGRAWYRPHREHLYQWMVRSGQSHVRVVVWYMTWNVVVVIPALYLMNRDIHAHSQARGWIIAGIVYALALSAWVFGKARCLRRIESETTHAAA